VLQRIALIVLVLFVLWRILSAFGRRLGQDAPGADSFSRFSPEKRRRRRQRAAAEAEPPEELVACSWCGTYIPVQRALPAGDGLRVCGTECRDALQNDDG